MSIEIERKFLVLNDDWRSSASGSGQTIQQGYLLSENGRTVRIRQDGQNAWLTIKGPVEGIARLEFEYPIPLGDAGEMLATLAQAHLVEKVRHRIFCEGFCFEVDEFIGKNAGLVVAEIELKQCDADFPRPGWLGEEVTGDHRYHNSHLARHPYSRWGRTAALA